MSSLAFVQRSETLIPQPRMHLIRIHGVPAPNAKLRALVVRQAPAQPEVAAEAAAATESEAEHHQSRPGRISRLRLLRRGVGTRSLECKRVCANAALSHRHAGVPEWRRPLRPSSK